MISAKKTVTIATLYRHDQRRTRVYLEQALEQLSSFPTLEENNLDNFIGFTTNRFNTIQFIRFNKDDWLVDIPRFEGKDYIHSLQKMIQTQEVLSLVEEFFTNDTWYITLDESEFKIIKAEGGLPIHFKFVLFISLLIGSWWALLVLLNWEAWWPLLFIGIGIVWLLRTLHLFVIYQRKEVEVIEY